MQHGYSVGFNAQATSPASSYKQLYLCCGDRLRPLVHFCVGMTQTFTLPSTLAAVTLAKDKQQCCAGSRGVKLRRSSIGGIPRCLVSKTSEATASGTDVHVAGPEYLEKRAALLCSTTLARLTPKPPPVHIADLRLRLFYDRSRPPSHSLFCLRLVW